jgi:hypothetical protein
MKRYGWLLILLVYQAPGFAQQATAPQSSTRSAIDFATVQDAYDALNADPTAKQSEFDGWTIFNQKADGKYIIWSFTPTDHPVHPSAVRREVVKKDGEVYISMDALCQANRFDCDQLIEQFKQINQNLQRRLAADSGS